MVVIFEDAHWIDATSRELLDIIVERAGDLKVLLIVTFRPEFQPPWAGQPRVTMLTLNRLDRRDRIALVAQVAGKALPDAVIDQIADRTDGVPLFVEELTKSVLESGLLRAEADRYVIDGALPPLAIPTSLYASLLARLDRPASARLAAQIGAAIGREFTYALLRAVWVFPRMNCKPHLLGWSHPSWCTSVACRLTQSTASSTRWCGTRLTAACCAAPGDIARADRRGAGSAFPGADGDPARTVRVALRRGRPGGKIRRLLGQGRAAVRRALGVGGSGGALKRRPHLYRCLPHLVLALGGRTYLRVSVSRPRPSRRKLEILCRHLLRRALRLALPPQYFSKPRRVLHTPSHISYLPLRRRSRRLPMTLNSRNLFATSALSLPQPLHQRLLSKQRSPQCLTLRLG